MEGNMNTILKEMDEIVEEKNSKLVESEAKLDAILKEESEKINAKLKERDEKMNAVQIELEKLKTPKVMKIENLSAKPLPFVLLKFGWKITLSVYRQEFERAAQTHGEGNDEKAFAPIIALRSEALKILQGIPDYQQNNFLFLIVNLKLKYGGVIDARKVRRLVQPATFGAEVQRLLPASVPRNFLSTTIMPAKIYR